MSEATPKLFDVARELALAPRRKLPSALDLDSLPLLSGEGGRTLTRAEQESLVHLLAAQASFEPAPLLSAVIAWADPGSAAELGWALFKQWDLRKYAKPLAWILYAVGLLGDEACAERLKGQIQTLLTSKRKPERERGRDLLPALGRMKGGPFQLFCLTRLAMERAEMAAIEGEIERAASERGMSAAALEEAFFPLQAELLAMTKPEKLPSIIKIKDAPPLVREGGEPLEKAMVEGVLRAAIAGGARPRGLGRLRSALTEASREAFALHLLALWKDKKFDGRYEWILGALGALGSDRTALALAPLLREWPKVSDTWRKRAIATLDVLRDIGTDTALLTLMGLRQKHVLPSVQEAAIYALQRAASDRGLSVSELADRITPTCGLDERGTRVWSYGAREFTLHIDDNFGVRVRDAEGEILNELPPARPGDDPALVERSRVDWLVITGQLEEALRVQSFRLEQDMVEGRRWPAEAWTRYLQRHPLMVHFTRRLLWGIYEPGGGGLIAGFRTAEDQSLVDIDDTEIRLPEGALVGLAHPLHMDEALRAAWGGHFADYQIIAPFPQLGRPLFTPTAEELDGKEVTRFKPTGFRSGVLRDTLVRKGWDRDSSLVRRFYERRFAGDRVRAEATLDPGISAGGATYTAKDQTIPAIKFYSEEGPRKEVTLRIGDVPKVVFSEALLDIHEVLAEQDAEASDRS